MNLAERYTPTPELAQAYSEHAPAMTLVPWWRRGQDYAERSLALRKHMHDRWGQGQSLHFLGVLLYSSARFAECVQRCEEAVDLLEETGDRWEANDAACNVSLALYRLGRLEDARELAERTYRKALAIGDTHSVGVCLEVLSKATNGQVDAARVQAALAQPTADVQTRSEVLQAEGVRLLLGERRVHDAVAVFSQAVDAVRRAGLRQEYVVSAYPWLATALRHAWEQLSPYDRARRTVLRRRWRRTVKQSLALAHDFPNNAPHALREAGLLAAAGGGTARARKLLERSVARARGLEMAHEEQLTREALTELEALSGWSAPSNAPHASGEYRRVATPNAVLVEAPSAPHFVFDAAAALKKRADEVDALKAAISAHQDLLSVAAHELRNPLAALTLKLDVLARKVQRGQCAPAELENGLANLGRTAQHLRKLLDTMQDVSGLAKGRIVFDLKPVDLSMLVQEVVERFSEELSRALVDLQLTLTDPIVGTWDLVRLDQVVSNLLVNAIKYGGGKPIQISTCKEQGFAVLHVADQGIGIAAEHQERIFKPFERAVSGRLYAGLGVGLWLSCALVEALGGTLTVQSRLGEGSVFTVRLPLPSATA